VNILLRESQSRREDVSLMISSDGSELPNDGDLGPKKTKGHAEFFLKKSKVSCRTCNALSGRMDQGFYLTEASLFGLIAECLHLSRENQARLAIFYSLRYCQGISPLVWIGQRFEWGFLKSGGDESTALPSDPGHRALHFWFEARRWRIEPFSRFLTGQLLPLHQARSRRICL
jgi:hypothetical protein